MIKGLVRLRLLKVTRCQDAMMWYAPLVGEYVPCLGFDHGEWKSRQPTGYSNFIAEDNARVVHVFVSPDKLGEYPYKYAQEERPAKKAAPATGQVPTPAEPAAQGCKARCDMLGVYRDLPDCEEALGRVMRMLPITSTHQKDPLGPAGNRRFSVVAGQSHRASAIEAATNIVLGFGISVGITAVLLPAFGHQVTLAQNVAMTSVFTVASFARAYGLRRLFNWLQVRGHGAKP